MTPIQKSQAAGLVPWQKEGSDVGELLEGGGSLGEGSGGREEGVCGVHGGCACDVCGASQARRKGWHRSVWPSGGRICQKCQDCALRGCSPFHRLGSSPRRRGT